MAPKNNSANSSNHASAAEAERNVLLWILAIAIGGTALFWNGWVRPYTERYAITAATAEARLELKIPYLLPAHYERQLENIVYQGARLIREPGIHQFGDFPGWGAIRMLSYPNIPLSYLTIALLMFAIYRIWQGDMKLRYRRVYKLDNLIRYMAKTRPFLVPIAQIDPNKLNPHRGPWRRKHTYVSFSVVNRLLCDGKKREYKKAPGKFLAAYFNAKKAEEVFAKQLGAPWKGPDSLTGASKAIFGIMAAMIAGTRQEGIDACDAVSASIKIDSKRGAHGRVAAIDYHKAHALADRYGKHRKIREIARAHHFTGTVFMALKAAVSTDAGEFGSGHYLWLKLVDRECFYIIHQVGLDVAHMEAAGPFAHYQTEVRTGSPARVPTVTPAVSALRAHLINENWLNPEALDL